MPGPFDPDYIVCEHSTPDGISHYTVERNRFWGWQVIRRYEHYEREAAEKFCHDVAQPKTTSRIVLRYSRFGEEM